MHLCENTDRGLGVQGEVWGRRGRCAGAGGDLGCRERSGSTGGDLQAQLEVWECRGRSAGVFLAVVTGWSGVSSRLMSVGVESISVLPERLLSRGPLAQCPPWPSLGPILLGMVGRSFSFSRP